MRVVYKYAIIQPVTRVTMPASSRVVSFREQNGLYFIWALVDTDLPLTERTFAVYDTGDEIKHENIRHIGTLVHNNLIRHLFEHL